MKIDPAQEYERLAQRYAQMPNEQLVLVSRDFADLTDLAQQTLRAEFDKRQLSFPETTKAAAPLASETAPVIVPDALVIDDTTTVTPLPDRDGLVVVRSFRDLPNAAMAKSALDSAGIQSFLGDDNIVRLDWFYSNLVGGVKVLVASEDLQAALEVLDQPIPGQIEFADGEEYEQPKCPECGSLDVSFQNLNQATAFGSAYVGIPSPYALDRWECQACGNRWKDKEEQTTVGEGEASEESEE